MSNPGDFRVICFDMDGTLLPMDIGAFLKRYFAAIERFVNDAGYDGKTFMEAMETGVHQMIAHEDGRLNEDVFWDVIKRAMAIDVDAFKPLVMEFYTGPYKELGKDIMPNPATAKTVETLLAKGYPLAVITMPVFPRVAIEQRLRWAGLDPSVFSRITTYENSTASKRSLRYYAENLVAFSVSGSDVMMFGNDTGDDLKFGQLGASCGLITDWLSDRIGRGLDGIFALSMEECATWASTLPPCEKPAYPIDPGRIDNKRTEELLKSFDAS